MRVVLDEDCCVLLHGDSAQIGDVLAENSVDSIVTDPPAGIAFMGKEWDEDKGGRDEWIAWLAALMRPAFRALKPGGHALVWALPRTSHWTACALEDSGFEIRDVHHHLFGTGMPKSLDLARQIDMHLCELPGKHCDKHLPKPTRRRLDDHLCPPHPRRVEAQAMRTALKPAVEHWILARKPLVGKYAENVLEHGTGGLNIEGCRPDFGEDGPPAAVYSGAKGDAAGQVYGSSDKYESVVSDVGRWPAHLSLEHVEACRFIWHTEKHECVIGCPVRLLDEQSIAGGMHGAGKARDGKNAVIAASYNATSYEMPPNRNMRRLGDSGGASRFFYVAKAPRAEKDGGLGHLAPKTGGEATGREDGSAGTENPRAGAGRTGGARNHHPTVKSIELMRWLIRLVTPPGGVVLDVFAGSGTTGVAALAEGLSFVGCELTDEYLPIVEGRLRHALGMSIPGTSAAPQASDTDKETP